MYKLCVKISYTCNMRFCLGTDSQTTTGKITLTTHSTIHVSRRVGVACKSLFSSANLIIWLLQNYIVVVMSMGTPK